MFADKKSENYSIQQIGIYRESTEKNFLFWYCYTNTKVDMHTVYFICVIASITSGQGFLCTSLKKRTYFANVCHCQVGRSKA